jgi:hypothetical protein
MKETGLSYQTAQKASDLLLHLPHGPQWRSHTITVDGYESYLGPITLLSRDSKDCTEYLFNNPLFADRMALVPMKLYTKEGKRIITEPITAKQAWQTQVMDN